jgi:hypothetical protein
MYGFPKIQRRRVGAGARRQAVTMEAAEYHHLLLSIGAWKKRAGRFGASYQFALLGMVRVFDEVEEMKRLHQGKLPRVLVQQGSFICRCLAHAQDLSWRSQSGNFNLRR